MNRDTTRPEGRLDELLEDIESYVKRFGDKPDMFAKYTVEEMAYIASLLRAGQRLRNEDSLDAIDNYDNAVRQNPLVRGEADGE